MTCYTLTKGKTKIQFRIDAETAEQIKTVGENIDTNKTVMTPAEATREINLLIRQGYTAVKR